MAFRNLEYNTRKDVRKLENILHKRINAKNAKLFNINCLRERLCPKSIKNSGNAQRTWTGVERLLRQRIKESERKEEETNEEYQGKWAEFSQEHEENTIRITMEYLEREARRYENIV